MDSLAIILQLHTPDELQFFSNLAHWIEGGLFALVSVLAVLVAAKFAKGKAWKYSWPILILAAGLFLPLFLFTHHFDELALAWKATILDAQQRQHMFMAILLIMAGGAEIRYLRSNRNITALQSVTPVVLAVIGILFFTHPQHGTSEAVLRTAAIHQWLGFTLIIAGILKFAEVLWVNQYPWLAYPWIVFLFITSLLLISYREPEGAYQIESMPSDMMNYHNFERENTYAPPA